MKRILCLVGIVMMITGTAQAACLEHELEGSAFFTVKWCKNYTWRGDGGEQNNVLTLGGTLQEPPEGAAFGRLFGIYIDMTNDWQGEYDPVVDNARVRGVIGTVTTMGPGSVRFAHGHAIAEGGATGFLNAFNGQVTAGSRTRAARAITATSTGAPGKVDGYSLQQQPGSDFLRGLVLRDARYTVAAIDLAEGHTNGIRFGDGLLYAEGGRLKWRRPSGGVVQLTR
jgi:hypothetical protein